MEDEYSSIVYLTMINGKLIEMLKEKLKFELQLLIEHRMNLLLLIYNLIIIVLTCFSRIFREYLMIKDK